MSMYENRQVHLHFTHVTRAFQAACSITLQVTSHVRSCNLQGSWMDSDLDDWKPFIQEVSSTPPELE